MDIGKVVSEAAALLTKNPVLAVPTVIAAFIFAALSMAASRAFGADDIMALVGPVGMMVNLFAQGVTMAMAREALQKGATGLGTGTRAASANLSLFLGAALIMSVVISVGLALFVIPGVIAVFFLMFTFPSIVVEGLGPLEAIKRGFAVVRANLKSAALLFVVLVAISFLFGVLNMIFMNLPVVGPVISLLLSGVFGGYIAIVIVRAYMDLAEGRGDRGTHIPLKKV